MSDLYISRIGLSIFLEPNRQTNPGNIKKYMNERGRVVSFLRTHISDFRYSALPVCGGGTHRLGTHRLRDASSEGRMIKKKGTGTVGTYWDPSS